jgi:hypothetical protein
MIEAKVGAACGDREDKIGGKDIRPLDGHRADPALRTEIGHPIGAPMIQHHEGVEGLAS